jgi:ribosome-binding factor A
VRRQRGEDSRSRFLCAFSAPPRLRVEGMPRLTMDERRSLRVSEAIREELAEIIGFETDDPRLLAVDVQAVHVSIDGRHATIRVGLRGSEREQRESLAALEHARGYLRHELALRLSLRHVPELHFGHDRNQDVESRIDFLLRRAKKSRGRTENKP